MTILIVEDNANMRRMLADLIGHKFRRVYECADGDKAFALYELHRPDWVLMDWQMPNKDGITAMREIIAEYPQANICLVTSCNDEFLKTEAIAAGAKCFVHKRNLAELQTVLNVN
jgi:two-component system, chemotaxis family, chemotaxis protein CheY